VPRLTIAETVAIPRKLQQYDWNAALGDSRGVLEIVVQAVFGFITPDDGSADLFAHFADIQADGFKKLSENQRVSFERRYCPKRLKASNIRPL